MTVMTAVALVAVAVTATALAGSDLARRRLPNAGVVALSLAVLALMAAGHPTDGVGPLVAVALGLAAGVVGVGVWSAGLMAAGDAKVLAPVVAVEAWMGSGPLLVYLGLTIVATAGGLAWLLAHRPERVPVPVGTILLVGVAPSALVLGVRG